MFIHFQWNRQQIVFNLNCTVLSVEPLLERLTNNQGFCSYLLNIEHLEGFPAPRTVLLQNFGDIATLLLWNLFCPDQFWGELVTLSCFLLQFIYSLKLKSIHFNITVQLKSTIWFFIIQMKASSWICKTMLFLSKFFLSGPCLGSHKIWIN